MNYQTQIGQKMQRLCAYCCGSLGIIALSTGGYFILYKTNNQQQVAKFNKTSIQAAIKRYLYFPTESS